MPTSLRVVLVGCGKMGLGLAQSWLNHGVDRHAIMVVEPIGTEHCMALGLHVVHAITEVPKDFNPDIILFAVKPQQLANVVPLYLPLCHENTMIMSIAAGKTIHFFESLLGSHRPIIRVMPNLPATVGKGLMAFVANAACNADAIAQATHLLAMSGTVVQLHDETLLDAVTAISGSGPAYFFHMVECLEQAGKALGLPSDIAAILAKQTLIGSGALLDSATKSAATLREEVTSPKGTTEAALKILMDHKRLATLMLETSAAALHRSHELAKS